MTSATVRFYGALNDFLPTANRQATLACAFRGTRSVKDLIEALGVPHPEIDVLVVNGRFADFAYLVRDGDRVAVYPPWRRIELGDVARLGPPPQAEPRWIADVHLGRLAAYLRLAGFDTAYRRDCPDREIVAISAAEDRTLLTRDLGVLEHRLVGTRLFPSRDAARAAVRGGLGSLRPRLACRALHALPALQRPAPSGAEAPRGAPAPRTHAGALLRLPSVPGMRPHLLAGLAPRAHAHLPRDGLGRGRGPPARDRVVSRAGLRNGEVIWRPVIGPCGQPWHNLTSIPTRTWRGEAPTA